MLTRGLGGLLAYGGRAGFAPASEPVAGNNVPAWTGSPGNTPPAQPGPHAVTQPIGGQVGRAGPIHGTDPAAAEVQPHHVPVLGAGQETNIRYGLQGFNDQLQVRDRHAYWSRGKAINFGGRDTGGGRNPNEDGPASPSLRAVNISLNPQIGSDATRSADDLSRPYTWLGQQDGSTQPVYGGVPGLWASYGNRGLSSAIHDPTNGEGGPREVISGPAHGLHSATLPNGVQVAKRYATTPQMRPGRLDRPDNSVIAGQSYSQTVQFQGQTGQPAAKPAAKGSGLGLSMHAGGRGWAGG